MDMNRSPATNATMVDELQRTCVLRSPRCIDAFLAADRRHFWASDPSNVDFIYADMPLRTGRLHLSAPHIYAKALESFMPLEPGMSFLNVGSGTGYFNSIVGELIGDVATNHGIDIWPEVVDHSRERCRAIGKQSIEFSVGNVYQLDVNRTTRYTRIYLGACANSRSKYLYRLLEVGGVLIGPFQTGHSQQLRRVTRHSESQFNVEVLGSVHFACLVEPLPVAVPAARDEVETEMGTATILRRTLSQRLGSSRSHGYSDSTSTDRFSRFDTASNSRTSTPNADSLSNYVAMGLPGVPFSFDLSDKPWCPKRCAIFPASFKQVVSMTLRCRPRNPSIAGLPSEVWIEHIFPWCPKWWFRVPKPALVATPISGPFSPLPRHSVIESPSFGCSCSPEQALPPLSPLLEDTQARKKSEDDLSDDGGSTHAPSSSTSSVQATPDNGPSSPPMGPELSESPNMSTRLVDEEVPFEVFGDGLRHTIGAQNDPDDMVADDYRLMVPLDMFQLMHGAAWHRRWAEHRDAIDEDDDDGQHDEDEEVEEDEDYFDVTDEDDEMDEDEEQPDVEEHHSHEGTVEESNIEVVMRHEHATDDNASLQMAVDENMQNVDTVEHVAVL